MKSSLVLLLLCIIVALVHITDAGKGKGKKGGFGKMLEGECKALMKLKDDKAFKECSTNNKKTKASADGDDDMFGGDGEDEKKNHGKGKGKGKKMAKMISCFLEAKECTDKGKLLQCEKVKDLINSIFSDQSKIPVAMIRDLDSCAICGLDISDEKNRKLFTTCMFKLFKNCKSGENKE